LIGGRCGTTRARSEAPAFDLNHPEAGVPVGIGGGRMLRDAPDAPTVDSTDGEVHVRGRDGQRDTER
jgi:hypothetical protein